MLNSDAITDIEVREPLQLYRNGSTVSITYSNIEPIWAKLTVKGAAIVAADGSTRTPYSWRKQVPVGGGNFADSADMVEGYNPAVTPQTWPAFGAVDEDAQIGSIVRLYQSDGDPNPDPAVNHGTEWFWVSTADKRYAVLKLQSFTTPTSPNVAGYPARLQKWVAPTPSTLGSWQDVSTTTVYVHDPNEAMGTGFVPGEFVYARFVQSFTGGPPAGDIYERMGLDALTVGGLGTYPGFSSGTVFTSVRTLGFDGAPFYTGDPSYPSLAFGTVYVGIQASTKSIRGILSGYPGSMTPGGGYNGSDPYRKTSVYQWARGGFTGFDLLGTNTLYLTNNAGPDPGFGGVPNDSDFTAWFNQGTLLLGGPDQFTVQVGGGQQGFVIAAPAGNNGTVAWGGTVSTDIYDSYTVHTHEFRVRAQAGLFNAYLMGPSWLGVTGTYGGDFSPTLVQIYGSGSGTSAVVSCAPISGTWGVNIASTGPVNIGADVNLGSTAGTVFIQGQTTVADPTGGGAPNLAGAFLHIAGWPGAPNGYLFVNGLYVGGLAALLALFTVSGGVITLNGGNLSGAGSISTGLLSGDIDGGTW